MAVIGIALTAFSVGLQKISGLGVDPFSVLNFGLANTFHVTYQTVYIVLCAVLLVIAFIFNKKLLGIANDCQSVLQWICYRCNDKRSYKDRR